MNNPVVAPAGQGRRPRHPWWAVLLIAALLIGLAGAGAAPAAQAQEPQTPAQFWSIVISWAAFVALLGSAWSLKRRSIETSDSKKFL